jgi:hypothetical protein
MRHYRMVEDLEAIIIIILNQVAYHIYINFVVYTHL